MPAPVSRCLLHEVSTAQPNRSTQRRYLMPTATPVLDTIVDITAASAEHSSLKARELMLARIAALVAIDAPPASYVANAGLASDSGVTRDDVQGVLIAIAPVVGTAKVVSAGTNLLKALGLAIAVAEDYADI